MKTIHFLSILLLLAPGMAFGEVFTDDLGREVKMDVSPKRIISLAPGVTEILFYLDLDNLVIGVSDFCDFPAGALKKEKVGSLKANLEKILSLQPDFIVGTAGVYQEENMVRFKQFGIPFFLFEPSSLEDIFSMIETLGDIGGVREIATQKVQMLRFRLRGLREKVSPFSRPRVLYVVDRTPLFSVGNKSFLNDLIFEAGGVNITGDIPKAYPLVSMEFVIQRDPEILILGTDPDQPLTKEQIQYWSRWSSISAVREGKIYKVNRDLLSRPGPRIIDGIEELAGVLHPSLKMKFDE
ncbi:MAG TPA: cobalamin-binding protein [Nitrospiria bacterium]